MISHGEGIFRRNLLVSLKDGKDLVLFNAIETGQTQILLSLLW